MERKTKRLLEFGPFRIDLQESVLLRDDKLVYLTPKVFDTLLVLVENRGRIMDKETLMQRVWRDAFVEDANLTVNISNLRKALGQSEEGDQYIETLPRRGYRFTAEVREVWTEEAALVVKEYTASHITIEEQESSDGAQIGSATKVDITPRPALAKETLRDRIRDRQKIVIVAASLAAIAIAAAFWFGLSRNSRENHQGSLGAVKLTRVTNIGKVSLAAISPDGKYVAYVLKDGRMQSLWAHHVATSREIEVIPPNERSYWAINFTPDSNYVDYCVLEGFLYRVAVLGGPSRTIIEDISSNASYSRDGKRLTFSRISSAKKETYLVAANADGTEQAVIATRTSPDSFSYSPGSLAWSPDGKTIAAIARHSGQDETYSSLIEIDIENGTERALATRRWPWLMGLAWTRDGGGIFVTVSDESYGSCQVWRLSYPGGELTRVTNDVSGYLGLSVTDDSNSLVTLQQTSRSAIWVAPNGNPNQAKQISSSTTDGMLGLDTTPNGKVVYTSKASGNWDLWIMNSDGTGRKQLTSDSGTNELPAITPDLRYVVFSSDRSGQWGLWRMDFDGGNPLQLTSGPEWVSPHCSRDGRWIVYREKGRNNQTAIWRVSIDGSEPVQLTHKVLPYPGRCPVSPDGKWIAIAYTNETAQAPTRLGIIPFEGGEPMKSFDLPRDITFDCVPRWTADGGAISFTRYNATSKIWVQPIDGSPARELTDLNNDGIWDFEWLPDRTLVYASGGRFGDAVLISNLK